MFDLVFVGKFPYNGQVVEGSVAIEEGKIVRFSKGELKGEKILRLGRGQVLLPGMIDVHVHLRDFEESHKETVKSGTMAAIHGGITTVFDMPNTRPPVMDERTFRLRGRIFRRSYADYALGFLLAGNCEEAKAVKADFYKAFMGASTGGIFSEDFEADYSCAPGPLHVHAEEASLIIRFPERPPIVEVVAIRKALDAAERIKKRLHICHVSTAEGLKEILKRGFSWVSFEVTPHHLFLTRRDYERNPFLKVYPPLRDEKDRRFLWEHIKDVPVIASDHAPHTPEDKEGGAAGLPGLETELALLLDAVNRGLLTLWDVVEKTALNPARLFCLKTKGFSEGKDADIIVVDLKREWVVRADDFYTKAGWSPYEGWRLKGKVIMTFLRGELVMEEDEIIGRPRGERVAKENGA
ncbi:dihydroorotase [Pyrococcus yayanosii]|uniref:Dihydroorotase n=1 Tax=Pyrococcus yayanosii (strain CH1 / JCM 16557) TaxID=529709 RepID=F8AJH5_PYRYC|nr:dihydroorotase [Pyrococcus yayanosii]AEH25250.1 dihydroorotase [Pyrococcus yayanosii CH1]